MAYQDDDNSNILYMCNFDMKIGDENDLIKKLWSGDWSIINTSLCKEIIESGLETETLKQIIKAHSTNEETMNEILHMAIAAFLTFSDINWTAHPKEFNLEEYFKAAWPEEVDVTLKLQRDSEPVYVNILYPELFYFSSQIFTVLQSLEQNLVNLWWYLRIKMIHQRILEETSITLYSDLELLIAKLFNISLTLNNTRIRVLLYAEIAQAYLQYSRIQEADDYLYNAKELAGLKLELTGVLGKRTKYQQNALPQLVLCSELDSDVERMLAETTHGDYELPPDIELDDDVRLNRIQFNEKIREAELPSLEQTLCLLSVQCLQKGQPPDELLREELQPYIETILSQKNGPWSTRVATLLIRCKLEATHKRTVERSLLQCESLVNDKTNISSINRLSYLWASGVPVAWTWRQQLAELYLSLGLVKAALKEYLDLQQWEGAVICYTLLQLRHKAAEVIQEQLDIKPSVKLLCLYGDATDDPSWYEKAWEFSGHKSSRAKRHWGNFLFDQKEYKECIPHYEACLEINSIQDAVWMNLGYAALASEQWEISAKAYRHYTYLQPNTFEAWNNLAKVYVKMGDKQRAYRSLLEALKFNYDSWKLWENVILVSIATKHFEDVIRGCHRLLEIQRKFEDIEVLKILVYAVANDEKDADGNGASRLRKRVLELFGRITSMHQNNPEIWQLYSDLSPTYLLKAQRLQKAYRGFTVSGNWPTNPETCKKVMELAQILLEFSLKARQVAEERDYAQANQQLSSARLTGQAVVRAVEKQDWPDTGPLLDALKKLLNDLTEYMKSVM